MAKAQSKKTAPANLQSNPAPSKNKKSKTTRKSAGIPLFSENDSKQDRMIALLKRPGGSTIEELMVVTSWQQHSVRGAMSGVLKKRLGLSISSGTEERGRVYRITGSVSRL